MGLKTQCVCRSTAGFCGYPHLPGSRLGVPIPKTTFKAFGVVKYRRAGHQRQIIHIPARTAAAGLIHHVKGHLHRLSRIGAQVHRGVSPIPTATRVMW